MHRTVLGGHCTASHSLSNVDVWNCDCGIELNQIIGSWSSVLEESITFDVTWIFYKLVSLSITHSLGGTSGR